MSSLADLTIDSGGLQGYAGTVSKIKAAIAASAANNVDFNEPFSAAPSYAANTVYSGSAIVRGIGADSGNLYCMAGSASTSFNGTTNTVSTTTTLTITSLVGQEPYVGMFLTSVPAPGWSMEIASVTQAWNGTTGQYVLVYNAPRPDTTVSGAFNYGGNNLQGKSGPSSPPTGTGIGVILDGSCRWFYFGKVRVPFTSYPLYSTVTPAVASDVTNGFVSFVNYDNITALGLTNTYLSNFDSVNTRVTGGAIRNLSASPSEAYDGHRNNPAGSSYGTSKTQIMLSTDARRWVLLKPRAGFGAKKNLNFQCEVYVNNRRLSETHVTCTGNGSNLSLLLDVSSIGAEEKAIALVYRGLGYGLLESIHVGPDENVWATSPTNTLGLCIEGTSLDEGGSWGQNLMSVTQEVLIANAIGFSRFFNNAVGGSNSFTGSTNFTQRSPEVDAFAPDILWVDFRNDVGFTTLTAGRTARQIAQRQYIEARLTANPKATIFVSAGFLLAGESVATGGVNNSTHWSMEQELKAEVLALGSPRVVFVPLVSRTPRFPASNAAASWGYDVADGHPNARFYKQSVRFRADVIRKHFSAL